MNAFTAAHKTLPLPSYARVTNLRNGRSIVVRSQRSRPVRAQPDHRPQLRRGAGARHRHRRHGHRRHPDGRTGKRRRRPSPRHDRRRPTPLPRNRCPIPTYRSSRRSKRARSTCRSGAYGDPFNAERMHQRLAGLGFDNVSVIPADIAHGASALSRAPGTSPRRGGLRPARRPPAFRRH